MVHRAPINRKDRKDNFIIKFSFASFAVKYIFCYSLTLSLSVIKIIRKKSKTRVDTLYLCD
jgi:hypothetical protein